MKLIIDISEEDYKWVREQNMGFELYKMIANGTPLEKHDAEVIKETVESIWGKPPYTEVLDKIRAEIEQYQADCDLSCSDDANCRTCDRITFDSIYRIIEKYKKGDKK